MRKNQTCWFNTVVAPNPSMLVFMSLLSRHCFMAVMDSGDRERETSSGGHYFFSPFEIPASFPHRLFPSLALSLSLTGSTVPYISFTWTLPLTLCYINFLSSQPIFSACSLTLTLLPRPTFHLFLWGAFLSDIDWIYLSAAVKLWKWVVSLLILCFSPRHYQQP